MKIAVTGKGGVGKTFFAASLAKMVDSIVPISKMCKMIEECTGASTRSKGYHTENGRRKYMIAFGCEDKNRSPMIEDRICPKCGREIEVFLLGGRIMEDAVCECGYIIQEQEPILMARDEQKKE